MIPATRILARSDDAQLRLQHVPHLEGIDCRLYRRSPAEADSLDAYSPTAAGFVLPVSQLREAIELLAEILRELEA